MFPLYFILCIIVKLLRNMETHDAETVNISIVREPAILLIKWLRPKGLKVCSYVEKYAEFKNQTVKKSAGTQKSYAQRSNPGEGNFSN